MTHTNTPSRYWIIVPAAGVGARMGAGMPKQYLTLLGKTILEHTLERLLGLPNVTGVLVAVNPTDNIKITRPEDLAWAHTILQQQEDTI